MRNLMMTTALVAATSVGATAQTADYTGAETEVPTNGVVPAFLASQFMGMTLYTLDSEAAHDLRSTHVAPGEAGTGVTGDQPWTSSDVFIAERDGWESVGSIGDIVMTQDGEVRGILIDIGGFLGFTAQTVMIDIDELYFISENGSDAEIRDFSVVTVMSRDQLEALPEWSDDQLGVGFTYGQAGYQGDATYGSAPRSTMATGATATNSAPGAGFGAPGGTAPGYASVDLSAVSVEQLLNASVYDATGENIGSVSDATLDDSAVVQEVIVDVGGFLGLGTHSVALPLDEAEILWNQDTDTVRVHLPMTRDELEAMPEYEG